MHIWDTVDVYVLFWVGPFVRCRTSLFLHSRLSDGISALNLPVTMTSCLGLTV